MPAIWISVVGRCEIHLGRSRIKPESAVFFGLLLYLGLRPGVRVTREELLELLWPGSPEQARRHSLRQLLYRIRRAEVPLELDGPEVVLDGANVHSDLAALFDDAWADTVAVEDVPSPLSLFAGYRHSLGPAFAAWVDGVREDACVAIRKACMRHISEGRREGRWPDVETVARIAIVCDPMNETAHMALAEATHMAGAKAEALRVLDTYLWELGDTGGHVGRDARVLRNRISEQPEFHLLRAGEPPLIGRAEELAWLNGVAGSVQSGASRAAMLVGEPGIGKTAVVRAFASFSALHGWQSVDAHLQPSDVGRSLGLLLELIPKLLAANGALGAAPDSIAQLRRLVEHRKEDDAQLAGLSQEPEAVQARIRASLVDIVGALVDESPLTVVLEDLHWIDASSLDLFAWLIQHVDGSRVMWLLTSRPEAGFLKLREAFPPERVPSCSLGPLNERDSLALLKAYEPRLVDSERVRDIAYAATGGNPLFIREVAGHLACGTEPRKLPRTLRALITERVRRLLPETQQLLNTCAILGRLATVERVAKVMDVPSTTLATASEELDRLGLVGLSGEAGSLALHDLWQEQLVRDLRPATRAVLSLRAGQVLQREASECDSVPLAMGATRLLAAGGSRGAALSMMVRAVEQLMSIGLYEDALTCLNEASSLTDDATGALRVAQLRLLALERIGDWKTILTSVPIVLALARKANPSYGGHTDLELIEIESEMLVENNFSRSVSRALKCSECTSASPFHRAAAGRIGARAASNAFMARELELLVSQVRQLDQSDVQVQATTLALETIFQSDLGDLDLAIQFARRLIDVERARGSISGLARALRFLTVPLRITGRFEEAEIVALESLELSGQHHLAEGMAAARDILASLTFEAGRLGDAERWLSESDRPPNKVGADYLRESFALTGAMVALERGRHEDAAALVERFPRSDKAKGLTRPEIYRMAIDVRISAERRRRDETELACTELASALRTAFPFRRLGYATASLGIGTAFAFSKEAAAGAVAQFANHGDTGAALWREYAKFGLA